MKRIFVFIVLVLCVACSDYSITGGPGRTNPKKFNSEVGELNSFAALNTVTLMPVVVTREIALKLGEGKSLFYDELEKQLRAESSFDIRGCVNECVYTSDMGSFPQSAWLRSLRASGSDAMLVLRVHSYEDRRGSAIGSESGAKLGFSAELINRSGQEIWRGSYYYQDEALSDNLLRISKSGGQGWHSVQKLYQDGIEMVAKDLAAKKMTAVSRN